MDYKAIGTRVKLARNGMSLREFGRICGGLSHTHIDSIEKGIDPRTGKEVRITLDTLEKLAIGIGCSVVDLVNTGLSGKEQTPSIGSADWLRKGLKSRGIIKSDAEITEEQADLLVQSTDFLAQKLLNNQKK